MSKDEKFEILTPRRHVRLRPNMYVGSTSVEVVERFVLGKWVTATYVPALLKMIDEIIDNSIDEAIRTNFKHANQISVYVKSKRVIVSDNGRGIPQDKIVDSTGEEILRPEAAWTRVNSGTSFDDERTTIGANGVGSSVVNFMSKFFIGRTTRDKTTVEVRSSNGAEHTTVTQFAAKDSTGTVVEFEPDFSLLSVNSFDEYDTMDLVQDRLAGLQIAFPEIKFKFNGTLIKDSTIKKYAAMFTSADAGSVIVQNPTLSFFFCASEDGHRATSYINGVHTRQGGAYNDYITNNIIETLTKSIKRKYKVEVSKSTIKGGLTFVLFARNFTNPKYDSQTKERLTNTPSEIKAHFDTAGAIDFDVIAKKIMACDDIIAPIVEAQLNKKNAADARNAALAQKKLKRVKVDKYFKASTKQSTLFLVEGDSALGFYVNVRDPKTSGALALRGVVMNTWGNMPPVDVLKNKELAAIVSVLGLDINDPNSVDNMDYEKVATLTDADHDGNHISGLLLAFFYRFWPRLFSEGKIAVTRTPIMISTKGKKTEWFYSYTDAKKFKETASGWHHRYIKGLASLEEAEYDVIINKPHFDMIEVDDENWFEVMFGDDSQLRKDWIRDIKPSIIA
jgi:DNA gyrase/topoisomerase IV subunit B